MDLIGTIGFLSSLLTIVDVGGTGFKALKNWVKKKRLDIWDIDDPVIAAWFDKFKSQMKDVYEDHIFNDEEIQEIIDGFFKENSSLHIDYEDKKDLEAVLTAILRKYNEYTKSLMSPGERVIVNEAKKDTEKILGKLNHISVERDNIQNGFSGGEEPAVSVNSGDPTKEVRFTNKDRIIPFTLSKANATQGDTYVRREDLLIKIANALKAQEGQKGVVFLSGIGGCGKSELARAYSYEHKDEYEEIFWLTCNKGNNSGLMDMMSAADTLREVKKRDTAAFTDKVLIIVDNCDSENEELFNDLECSTGKAPILVTTRLSRVGSYEHIISVESDDPGEYAYAVFEKNYCHKPRWKEKRVIEAEEVDAVKAICKKVQYNTMVVSMIGIRLREDDGGLTIKKCADRIERGLGKITGKIKYSKDQQQRNEEMRDILRFLFSDILSYSFSEEQKQVMTVLSLMPAKWVDRDYLFPLLKGPEGEGDYAFETEELLDRGWLQGDNVRVSIHSLIFEAISAQDSLILIRQSDFFSRLLYHYLGMDDRHLGNEHSLINAILDEDEEVPIELKLIVGAFIDSEKINKNPFIEIYDDVNEGYLAYLNRDGQREFLYMDLAKKDYCSIMEVPSITCCDAGAYLVKVFNIEKPYTLDLTDSLCGNEIVSIRNGACQRDRYLNELIFPKKLKSIGCDAFIDCINLTGELKLPESLESIGDFAFNDCIELSGELKLPESLTSIGNGAFYGCGGLSGELKLPEKPISIGEWAFYDCYGLSGELKLPEGMTSIGDRVFDGCSGLSGELKLPESLVSIGDSAFYGCGGLSGDLKLPENLTSIGGYAFNGCSGLNGKLKLPSGLTSIAESVFNECSGLIGDLKLPENLTSIGDHAFDGCSGLSGELKLPESLTSIGDYAFSDCSGLSGELKLPESLTSITDAVFYDCRGLNGELKLPKSLTSIGDYAFYDCSGLHGELKLPESLTSIGDYAFAYCSGLRGKLRLPCSLANIGIAVFRGCKFK